MAQMNLIGKNILGYTVSEKLGSGAFGTVYKVVKINESGQYVRALKHITIPTEKQYNSVLNSMGGDTSKADNYFQKMLSNIVSEIKILNDLSEKGIQHIVRYYENDIQTTDTPKRYDIYILMEYLTPLDEYIKNSEFLVRDVVKLGLDILSGLQSCHDNGVIHRDIKEDNIFVSNKGEYKIGDFGVSKVLKDSSKAESLKGTPNFLAPEVYLGKEGYTKSVDLYSLGIVLYRFLNYSRNPFLPEFPEQYFTQDEDRAFEERMSGKTPSIPALGGEKIGQVIVKAISNSSQRFQDANEFIKELEEAFGTTSDEILNKSVKINTTTAENQNSDVKKQYALTMAEIVEESIPKCNEKDTFPKSLNNHLFDSIGEVPPTYTPDDIQVTDSNSNTNITNSTDKKIINFVPIGNNMPEETTAIDKKIIGKIVFAVPIILLLIGIIAYLIIIPNVYGKVVSFIDWLFTTPQTIIDTLRDPDTVLPKAYSIIGIKIFWQIWLISLITSLFFVGKHIHTKSKAVAINALFVDKDPYFAVQSIMDELKQLKTHINNKQLDSLIYTVKKLEEKLSVESRFGYGKNAVIECENEIAKQIQSIVDAVPCIENGNIETNLKMINSMVMNINSLLRKRTELKKR